MVANFNITDLYNNRRAVAAQISTALEIVFANNHAIFHDFQLRSVSFPDVIEKNIIAKLLPLQAQKTAVKVQQQQAINADIVVIEGEVAQQIALFRANQTQMANVLLQNSESRARQWMIDASADAYHSFQGILDFSNAELVRYLYLKNTRDLAKHSTIAVGYKDVLALVNTL